MKKVLTVSTLLLLGLASVTLGGKPGSPPPPPPPYALRMLENEFLADGFSRCTSLNNLGDAIGVAEIPGEPLPGGAARTDFVSTPEGRAAGADMVDLAALFTASLSPEDQLVLLEPEFIDINDSRQLLGRVAFVVDGALVEWRVIIAQLTVTPEGAHAISSYQQIATDVAPLCLNNDGDALLSPFQIYRSGLGLGAPIISATAPAKISDRGTEGTLYICGNASSRGVRITYDVVADAVTNSITLEGTYSKDRSSRAYDVSASGLVVGEMRTGRDDWRAYRYENGVMKNLGNLTSATSWNESWANAVNEVGDVVGGSMTGTTPENSGLLYVHSLNATYDSADTLTEDDRAIYTSLLSRDSADINEGGVICGPLGSQPVLSETLDRAYLLVPVLP